MPVLHRYERPIPPSGCKHRIASIIPIVAVRVQDGYASRCLLCEAVGPVMRTGENSRHMLIDEREGHSGA
jgi:hypothetical protein